MPWAAQERIAVQLVGEPWWQGLIGPVALAVAAILAAAIAAYVATHNHRRQLEHDRTERDREHARESIRAAAKTVGEIFEPLTAYELAVRADDKATKEVEALETSEDERAKRAAAERQLKRAEKVRDTRVKAEPLVVKTMVDSISLRISFGAESAVFQSYRELSLVFKQWFEACAPTKDGRTERDAREDDEANEEIHHALVAFQTACEDWSVQQPPTQRSSWVTRVVRRKSP